LSKTEFSGKMYIDPKQLELRPYKDKTTGEIKYLSELQYLFSDEMENLLPVEETPTIKVLYGPKGKTGEV
jgi:hypothetical protein